MSPMVQRETRIYQQILTLLLVLAAVTVSGCLGLLWLRQKIELTAQATRSLETEIVKEERRLRYLDTKIAEVHQPLYLERQIERLGLRLRPPMEDQVVYMPGWAPSGSQLAQRGREAGQPRRERDPFRHSIDLAVMDALLPVD
jgi:hypothetical protein